MDYAATAEELAEFGRRTAPGRWSSDPECRQDPLWRLANLYQIQNANGVEVRFKPTPEQVLVLICIFLRGWLRLVIPKSRQLGMSTLLALVGLDGCLFIPGFKGALIDKGQDDAKQKLEEKISFAFEKLHPRVLQMFHRRPSTKGLFIRTGLGENSFRAGINYRGGTVQFLWVSEWGAIQHEDRLRSAEIQSGAMPAVEKAAEGLCVIESTWKGGLDGEPGAYVKMAQQTPEQLKGRKGWRVLFFGWHTDPANRTAHGVVSSAAEKYFAGCAAKGLPLDGGQRLWYAAKMAEYEGRIRKLKEEYPTFVEECWDNSPEGAIFAEEIALARAEGRVRLFEHDARWPVHTFWDFGHPLNTVCVEAQVTPNEIFILNVDMERDVEMSTRAAEARARGWKYGFHYLPWETHMKSSTVNAATLFKSDWGHNVREVEKCVSVWHGITATKRFFRRFVFHSERCRQFLEHLAMYRAERETSSGVARDAPVHDKYSHPADALRQLGQSLEAGKIENGVSQFYQQSASVPVKKAGW